MNEISSAIRIANAGFKAVRIMEIMKKITIITASVLCLIFTLNFFRKR